MALSWTRDQGGCGLEGSTTHPALQRTNDGERRAKVARTSARHGRSVFRAQPRARLWLSVVVWGRELGFGLLFCRWLLLVVVVEGHCVCYMEAAAAKNKRL